MKRLAVFSLLLSCLSFTSGCWFIAGGALAGAGAYVYAEGKLTREYNVNIDRAYSATQAALQDLKLPVSEKSKELSEASIKAKDGDKDVWINLNSKTKDKTEITVRVGLTGDEQASRRIHEAIHKHL